MIYICVFVLIVVLVALKLYQKRNCQICKCEVNMSDKTVIVTGANTGIGFETAQELARRGARVILACRNTQKGIEAMDKIVQSTGNIDITLKHLDLASFKSVRDFAYDILENETTLHVLINNAGIGMQDNSLTVDKLPVELQVNYYGPFLLTMLLLPLLKSSAPSRIVNVSSIMHWLGRVEINAFDKPARSYLQHRRVYCNAKLANILFTNMLSKQLQETGVTANSLNPGGVNTEFLRDKNILFRLFAKVCFKTPFEGAQTSIHLAVAPELADVSGKYFSNCAESRISKTAQNMDLAEKLWKLSEKAVDRKED